jgi:hypothetical protein
MRTPSRTAYKDQPFKFEAWSMVSKNGFSNKSHTELDEAGAAVAFNGKILSHNTSNVARDDGARLGTDATCDMTFCQRAADAVAATVAAVALDAAVRGVEVGVGVGIGAAAAAAAAAGVRAEGVAVTDDGLRTTLGTAVVSAVGVVPASAPGWGAVAREFASAVTGTSPGVGVGVVVGVSVGDGINEGAATSAVGSRSIADGDMEEGEADTDAGVLVVALPFIGAVARERDSGIGSALAGAVTVIRFELTATADAEALREWEALGGIGRVPASLAKEDAAASAMVRVGMSEIALT